MPSSSIWSFPLYLGPLYDAIASPRGLFRCVATVNSCIVALASSHLFTPSLLSPFESPLTKSILSGSLNEVHDYRYIHRASETEKGSSFTVQIYFRPLQFCTYTDWQIYTFEHSHMEVCRHRCVLLDMCTRTTKIPYRVNDSKGATPELEAAVIDRDCIRTRIYDFRFPRDFN